MRRDSGVLGSYMAIIRQYHEAKRLLSALLEGAPEEQFQEFRGVPPDRGGVEQVFIPTQQFRGDDAFLPIAWDGRLNAYYSLAPRAQRAGRAENVQVAGAVWNDEITKAPPDGIPPASITVETSVGKVQQIWLLDGYTSELSRIELVNRKLVTAFGGDHVWDRARVLRLPGFENVKPEHPTKPRAFLLEFRPERRYRLADLEAAMADIPAAVVAQSPQRTAMTMSRPLSQTTQLALKDFLSSAGLRPQRDGSYRGNCPFTCLGIDCGSCERAFRASPDTGLWACWCSEHPGAGERVPVGGGPKELVALAGVEYRPGPWRDRHGHLHLPRMRVEV